MSPLDARLDATVSARWLYVLKGAGVPPVAATRPPVGQDSRRPLRSRCHHRSVTAQRIAKWPRWIDGPIKGNVLTMHLQRDASWASARQERGMRAMRPLLLLASTVETPLSARVNDVRGPQNGQTNRSAVWPTARRLLSARKPTVRPPYDPVNHPHGTIPAVVLAYESGLGQAGTAPPP